MKKCGEDCVVICDFCVNFRRYPLTEKGYCCKQGVEVHSLDSCDEFYCFKVDESLNKYDTDFSGEILC